MEFAARNIPSVIHHNFNYMMLYTFGLLAMVSSCRTSFVVCLVANVTVCPFISFRLESKKAAIGFTYEDSTPQETDNKKENWEDEESEESDSSLSDIDLGNAPFV